MYIYIILVFFYLLLPITQLLLHSFIPPNNILLLSCYMYIHIYFIYIFHVRENMILFFLILLFSPLDDFLTFIVCFYWHTYAHVHIHTFILHMRENVTFTFEFGPIWLTKQSVVQLIFLKMTFILLALNKIPLCVL